MGGKRVSMNETSRCSHINDTWVVFQGYSTCIIIIQHNEILNLGTNVGKIHMV